MESSSYIELRRKRDFGQKINIVFEFLRQNFKSLFKSIILIAGPPILLASLFVSSYYSTLMNRAVGAQTNPQLLTEFFSPAIFIEAFGMFIFILVAYTTAVSVVNNFLLEYESGHGGPIPVQAVWKRVSQTLPRYFGTVILLILFVIIVVIVVLVPGILLLDVSPVFGGLLIFAGVIFYIFLIIKMVPIFCVRGFESHGFIESIRRSFYLTRGKWWSTLGILMILTMIQAFASYMIMIPGYIIFFVKMMHSVGNGGPPQIQDLGFAYQVIMVIFYMANLLLYALPLLGVAFQYFNLVELKDATGLMSKISQIGESPGAPKTHEDF